jgi:hypothetical protein
LPIIYSISLSFPSILIYPLVFISNSFIQYLIISCIIYFILQSISHNFIILQYLILITNSWLIIIYFYYLSFYCFIICLCIWIGVIGCGSLRQLFYFMIFGDYVVCFFEFIQLIGRIFQINYVIWFGFGWYVIYFVVIFEAIKFYLYKCWLFIN